MAFQPINFVSGIGQIRKDTQLNHAEGPDLNVVGSNLGIDRPIFGFEDKLYRATIRNHALTPKLITQAFETAISFALGPRATITNVLTKNALIDDTVVSLWSTNEYQETVRVKLTADTDPNDATPELGEMNKRTLTVDDTDKLPNGNFKVWINAGSSEEEEGYVIQVIRSTNKLILKEAVNAYHSTGEPVEIRRAAIPEIPQIGELVFEPGTANEEVVGYKRNDLNNDQLILDTPLTINHTIAYTQGSSTLTTAAVVGDSQLVLSSTSTFPVSDFIIAIDNGLSNTETVLVGYNDTTTNTLYLKEAIEFDHALGAAVLAPKFRLVNTVQTAALAGATSLVLNSSDDFPAPASVFNVVLDRGGPHEEIVRVTANNTGTETLTIPAGLQFDHDPGEMVEFGNVFIRGVKWDIDQSIDNKVIIRIPEDSLDALRLKDATYLHPAQYLPVPTDAVFTGGATAGDTFLNIDSGAEFQSNGVISIGGGSPEDVEFINNNYFATTTTHIIAGGTTLQVANTTLFPDASLTNTFDILIDRAGVAATRTVTAIDRTTNTLTVSAALPAGPLDPGTTVEIYPTVLTLATGLVNNHLAADSVTLLQQLYASTDLEDGDDADNYQGHYIYNPGLRGRSEVETTLNETIPAPTFLLAPAAVSDTTITVDTSAMFPTPPFDIRVGSGTANNEVVTVKASGKKASTALTSVLELNDTTFTVASAADFPAFPFYVRIGRWMDVGLELEDALTATASAGATSLTVADTTIYPQNQTFYVRISAEQTNEEIAQVISIGGPTTLNVAFPLQKNHASSDTVDVLRSLETEEIFLISNVAGTTFTIDTTTTPIQYRHGAAAPYQEMVELMPSTFELDVTTPLTNPHSAYESVELLKDTVVLTSTAGFTTSGIAFLSYGSRNEEQVTYTGTTGGTTLTLAAPITFQKPHSLGGTVTLSKALSNPGNDGNDFGAYMPPDKMVVLRYLFDLLRAAGVEVIIEEVAA